MSYLPLLCCLIHELLHWRGSLVLLLTCISHTLTPADNIHNICMVSCSELLTFRSNPKQETMLPELTNTSAQWLHIQMLSYPNLPARKCCYKASLEVCVKLHVPAVARKGVSGEGPCSSKADSSSTPWHSPPLVCLQHRQLLQLLHGSDMLSLRCWSQPQLHPICTAVEQNKTKQ
jgi:hypothetical protein